ncbi:MAG TPA: GxxExxY protein [Lentisphaeria bacterium]|nr:MAG: GxxExxY protein [Lentisphaerae bacterium GWF2_49_21]HBC85704.1 GxxExxY protein [Lentisphaeria bacterium]
MDYAHKEITEKIISCCYNVYNKMGFGYLESVYEKCLLIELEKAGLKFEAQKPINVLYDGKPVGQFVADILVEDRVIVELKSVQQLAKVHEAQLVNYLVATDKPIGLLINFGEEKVQVKRKVKDLKDLNSNPVNPVILFKRMYF